MVKSVAVIGSGAMGNGIAHCFAQHGFEVNLIDISSEALSKAMETITKNLDRQIAKGQIIPLTKTKTLANISCFTTLAKGIQKADLVVEAVSENLDIKLKIFEDLDQITSSECILASNTSSISITKLASATKKPHRVIGMHFMNPVPLMPLVEVIKGNQTSKETMDEVLALSKVLGKSPVAVNDYPGFVANRVLMPMVNEAIYALYEGVAGVEEIDTVMKLGMAHPMGPLQLADFIGLDVCLSILNVLQQGFGNPKYAPCPLLVNMVAGGNLGKKSGSGFYNYHHGTKDLVVATSFI